MCRILTLKSLCLLGYKTRTLCLKAGRSDTPEKVCATLWITTLEPQLSTTRAPENPLCKILFFSLCFLQPRVKSDRSGS